MPKSGVISKSNSYCTLEFVWEITATNRNTRTSTVNWEVVVIPVSSGVGYIDMTSRVDGVTFPKRDQNYRFSANQRVVIDSGVSEMVHDTSGKKSFKVYLVGHKTSGAAMSIPVIYENDATAVLFNIFPEVNFTSSPKSITDETSTLSFAYKVPEPSATTVAKLGIDFGNGYSYANLSTSSTSYTYSVTAANQKLIRDDNTTSKTFTVNYHLQSVVDGETYDLYASSSGTFVNPQPDVSVTVVDTNTTVTELTGDANTMVRGQSNAEVTVVTTTKKSAYIVSETVVNGSQTLDYGSGVIYNIDSPDFVVTVEDSRGYIVNKTISKNYVYYIPVTCNMTVDIPTSAGSTTVRLSGNCYYGSFGRVSNTLTLQYRYKVEDGYYSSWQTVSVTLKDNNTYAANVSVTGLDYTKGYTFEAQAIDKLDTATTPEIKVKATPVFDWSTDDFNFNVPVNFAKGFTQPNSALKQLWNGQYHMNSTSTTITLIEPISSQANGIVLIFTPYNSTTGLANDEKLMSFFISKKAVQVMPNKLHTFFLVADAGFSAVGAKSLYIGDQRITGYVPNGNSGTASSITYNNAGFVLRYVLGV